MTDYEAMKLLHISEADLPNLTVVKMSRIFAKAKGELEEDDPKYEAVIEAFEYLRQNIVKMKNNINNALPDDLFPQINTDRETKQYVGTILDVTVDGIPSEISPVKSMDGSMLFLKLPKGLNTQDNVVFLYKKRAYEGRVAVKNITPEQHSKLMGR